MRVTDGIYARAEGRWLGACLLALIVLSVILMGIVAPVLTSVTGMPVLDVRFGYSPEEANAFFGALGNGGMALYLILVGVDTLYPAVYALSASLALGMLHMRVCRDGRLSDIVLLPLLAAAFDYGENILLLSQALSYPTVIGSVIEIASILTAAKWIVLTVVLVLILLEGLYHLVLVTRIRGAPLLAT
ncbi:MAG: hypothetical protein ACTSYX_04085 [Candidatus Thorarchaeota archaeon]